MRIWRKKVLIKWAKKRVKKGFQYHYQHLLAFHPSDGKQPSFGASNPFTQSILPMETVYVTINYSSLWNFDTPFHLVTPSTLSTLSPFGYAAAFAF